MRWIATGPDLRGPSAASADLAEVLEKARARARFYGSALVLALHSGGAEVVLTIPRDQGEHAHK